MIAVIDYGSGNLQSVRHALNHLGADVIVTSDPDVIRKADRLVLPGQGVFGKCVDALRVSGLVEAIDEQVRQKGRPLLGICVGLQVLAREGMEMGTHVGLNWIAGVVRKLPSGPSALKLPHVGWNEVEFVGQGPLFRGFRPRPTFYFVHSYHLALDVSDLEAARAVYGVPFTAAVKKDTVFATQFHPEKSQENGLRLLENFLGWKP